ncbi:MAG: tRNA pseudouridine(55) synthase TruB [Casimicrobiaceae bacterium]
MTKQAQYRRPPRRKVDGILLLDKPVGVSSNTALQHVKRLYNADKAGHTGTLDPLASGLLPICFGEATKFAHLLLDADKAYVATLRFGITTTTGDAEGDVVLERPMNASREDLEALLPRFTGHIAQRPPRHAALKYHGRNYYEYAREGIEIPRAERPIVVHDMVVVSWSPPHATLAIRCGKGTYVRVLAEDLGEALGCGAQLSALRRTATGAFELAGAVAFDSLGEMDSAERDRQLLPVDAGCATLPRVDLAPHESAGFRDGQAIARAGLADGAYRTYTDGVFAGVAKAASGMLQPRRLVAAQVCSAAIESLES